ncbi:CPBP family intramembrane glutamic endopeptidase [Bombilactobacillus thymidiniphilus]|uniref:CPBP family intramembrane metalloprotease n=1 Tax=Bombilactobacillus thymidiniphilus TaxID=2923363 RepID=A0ABY4PDF7_9LACO|nr:CPBP family intramembrane glutamic endopeptidase [Bombilactobacillus thymidiniphilus]UQS83597.1 CPBP family intramembrane metalloprotease [Bombilactobacillus thymidiniphilus]UQS83650.1 CPBP family intramembrane metalloprotease [Bombilactobacillus thymidiniphilus]
MNEKIILIFKGIIVLLLGYILGFMLGGLLGDLFNFSLNDRMTMQRVTISTIRIILAIGILKIDLFQKTNFLKCSLKIMAITIFISFIINNNFSFHLFKYNMIFGNFSYALSEEIFYRAILFTILYKIFVKSKKSFLIASIIGSLFFAFAHFFNIINNSQSFKYTIVQVFFAFVIGMFLCLLYKVSNNIIFPILTHFVIDLVASCSPSVNIDLNIIISVIVFLLVSYLIYSLIYKKLEI